MTNREDFEAWCDTQYRIDRCKGVAWSAWQAALSRYPGYVLVPVEPTAKMIAAGMDASSKAYEQYIEAACGDGPKPDFDTSVEAIYVAMIELFMASRGEHD